MNVLKSMILGGCVAALTLSANNQVMAQGRNFDPAQMKQNILDRTREQLEVKDDAEWKAIEPIVGKVVDAGFQARATGMRGMFGGRGGRRGGNSDTNNASTQQRPNRPSPFGEPSAAVAALQKAI